MAAMSEQMCFNRNVLGAQSGTEQQAVFDGYHVIVLGMHKENRRRVVGALADVANAYSPFPTD